MNGFYLFIFIVFCLLGFAQAQCSYTNPCQLTGGGSYSKPAVQHVSNRGQLQFDLTVDVADITYDWFTTKRRVYDGGIVGPTWRIKPGDVVKVKLINGLTTTTDEERKINKFRFPNVTNLHTHGLHISGIDPQDNVFVHVEPYETHQYTYQIDAENPAGTYWYHAHVHGSTMFQVQGGLSGLIIVEDPASGPHVAPAHLQAISCPTNCQHDMYFLFQPILQYADKSGLQRGFAQLQGYESKSFDDHNFRHMETVGNSTLEGWLTDPKNDIDHFTTNGILFPVLTFPAGQRKRFRMVNAGGSKTLEVLITDRGTNIPASCSIYEIAIDGIYLDAARRPRMGKSFLVPATRVDWIVVCDDPGTYELRSLPAPADQFSMGDIERHDGLLVTIVVTGPARKPTEQSISLPSRPFYVRDYRHLRDSEVQGRFVVEANSAQHLNREKFMDKTYYRFRMETNKTQEWYLTNTDPINGHPMHIHVNHFQVISYNKYTGPVSTTNDASQLVMYSQDGHVCDYQSSTNPGDKGTAPTPLKYNNHNERALAGGPGTLGYAEIGDFRDVLLVPPLANITIRFLAHKYTGIVVVHCHILVHEDLGMMMTGKVVNQGESLDANVQSGDVLPGQCSGSNSQILSRGVALATMMTGIMAIIFYC